MRRSSAFGSIRLCHVGLLFAAFSSSAIGATLTVTTNANSGGGSLRAAITTAQADGAADTIVFDASLMGQTITIASAFDQITTPITITGFASNTVTINGNNSHRPFIINGSGSLTLRDLRFQNCYAIGGNGGEARSDAGGGGGAPGLGGAIWLNAGTLDVRGCTFTSCRAQGGNGGGYSIGITNGGGGGAGIGGSGADSPGDGVGGAGSSGGFLGGSGGSAASAATGEGGGGGGGNTGQAGGAGSAFGGGGGGGGSGVFDGGPGGYGAGGGGGAINANFVTGLGGTFGGNGTGLGGNGGRGAGLGGAIFIRAGTATITHSVFTSNVASFGFSGGVTGAAGKGGAIFVHPNATVYAGGLTHTSNTAAQQGNSATDNHNTYGTIIPIPTVSSINRAAASPTSASSVTFTVTFTESVTGVDTGDFAVTTTGTATGAVASISGSGATYTVTVNGVGGNGTVRLGLSDDNSITNSVARALGGVETGDGDFSTGETYTIETVAPTVQSVSVNSALTVDVTFDEAMESTGATTSANYALSGSGQGSLSAQPDSVALQSGNTYRLTWNSGEMFNGGDITITVSGATDIPGNSVGTPNAGTAVAGGIGTLPTVLSATVVNSSTIDVVLSEALFGSSALTQTNYAISGPGVGSLGTHPSTVALETGTTYRLTWATGEMKNGENITVTVENVSDAAGHIISGNNTAMATGVGLAPTVASVAVVDGRSIDVAFDDAMNSADLANAALFALSGTGQGTLLAQPDSAAAQSSQVARLTWNSGEMFNGGDLTITVGDGMRDAAGNLIMPPRSGSVVGAAIGSAATVSVTPRSTSVAPGADVVFDVVFSESVSGFAAEDLTIANDGTAVSSVSITATDASNYVVTLVAVTGTGTVSLQVNAAAAVDAAGNSSTASAVSALVTVVEPPSEPTPEEVPEVVPEAPPAASGAPILTVTLHSDALEVEIGAQVRLVLGISNSGDGAATQLVVTIPLPGGVELISVGESARATARGEVLDGAIRVTIDTLAPGESIDVELLLRAMADGEIKLSASALARELTQAVTAASDAEFVISAESADEDELPGCGGACGSSGPIACLFGLSLMGWQRRRRGAALESERPMPPAGRR